MNLNKHREFFDPQLDITEAIHIIGVGAVGSSILEMMARLGVEEVHIYDFDTVEPHNITNQMFFNSQIGNPKEDASTDIATMINPDMKIIKHGKYINQQLAGYVFLCVDNIELRKEICENNYYNNCIKAIFDIRMRLTDAQAYCAKWNNKKEKDNLLKTMNFTHEEAKETTPLSACGTSLNVTPTVRIIVSLQISNWINIIKGKEYKKVILIDAFNYDITTF